MRLQKSRPLAIETAYEVNSNDYFFSPLFLAGSADDFL